MKICLNSEHRGGLIYERTFLAKSMRNNHGMHVLFSPLSNLFFIKREIICSHRIIQAIGEGNHLKLEISHVTIMRHGEKKKRCKFKMAQRQNQIM